MGIECPGCGEQIARIDKGDVFVCEKGHTGANGLGAGESDVYKTLGTSRDGPITTADLNANTAIGYDMAGTPHVGGDAPSVCL